MAAPPGTLSRPNALAGLTCSEKATAPSCLEALVRAAHESPEVAALGLGPRKIVRVVRSFITAGLHERDLVGYVVGYSDPTGEAAVGNVFRERGW